MLCSGKPNMRTAIWPWYASHCGRACPTSYTRAAPRAMRHMLEAVARYSSAMSRARLNSGTSAHSSASHAADFHSSGTSAVTTAPPPLLRSCASRVAGRMAARPERAHRPMMRS